MNSFAKLDRLNAGMPSHARPDQLAGGVQSQEEQSKESHCPISAKASCKLLISLFCWAAGITVPLMVQPTNAMQLDRTSASANSTIAQTQPLSFLISQRITGSLRLDDSGDAVAQLQSQLAELGYYDGAIDGDFGAQTEDAVIRFQQANGLEADGIVGSATQAAITQALSSRNPPAGVRTVLQRGDSGAQVSALQERLAALRYYTGGITGIFGPETEAAVIAFQTANGLAPDGLVGPATQEALRRSDAIAAGGGSPSTPAPVTPSPVDDGILELGDTGAAVIALQTRLRDLGFYTGAIDGDFGGLTRDAVIQFQQSQGLTPDGRVGSTTQVALANPRPGQPSPTPLPPVVVNPTPVEQCDTPTGRFSVRDLQQRLQARGFYQGPINGCLDERTRAAIAAARNPYNLSPNDFAR